MKITSRSRKPKQNTKKERRAAMYIRRKRGISKLHSMQVTRQGKAQITEYKSNVRKDLCST